MIRGVSFGLAMAGGQPRRCPNLGDGEVDRRHFTISMEGLHISCKKKDRERDSRHPYKVVKITPPPGSLDVRCFTLVQAAAPISKGELGRATWTFLHTLAAQDNIEWAKFRKDGFPQYPDMYIVFGDTYATGDYAIRNAEHLVVSEGEDNGSGGGNGGGALVGDPNELSDGVFTPEVSATQVCENHKLNRTSNSKRKRKSSTYDIAGTCKEIQDMIKSKAGQSTSDSITSHALPLENPYSMGAVVTILNDMPDLE